MGLGRATRYGGPAVPGGGADGPQEHRRRRGGLAHPAVSGSPPTARAVAPHRGRRLGLTIEDCEWCRERIARLWSEGIFTPPSLEGTVVFPGFGGGMHWGGVSSDPARGLLIVNTNRLAFVVTLVPREHYAQERAAAAGRSRGEFAPQRGTPYGMYRGALLTPNGAPCNAPPWGTLAAVDLATGDVRWEVPLGTVPEAARLPQAPNGARSTSGARSRPRAAWSSSPRRETRGCEPSTSTPGRCSGLPSSRPARRPRP
jgi:quinoprotein glucose dehydrogenase